MTVYEIKTSSFRRQTDVPERLVSGEDLPSREGSTHKGVSVIELSSKNSRDRPITHKISSDDQPAPGATANIAKRSFLWSHGFPSKNS